MKTLTSPSLLRLSGALVLAFAAVACSGTAGSAPVAAPAPAPVAATAPAGGLAQIQAAIGEASCDAPAQCKSLAVGAKACGGPERYLPYSTRAGNGATIERLAAEHAAQRKASDAKGGMMSTCSVVLDPGATCSAGRCVAGGANAVR